MHVACSDGSSTPDAGTSDAAPNHGLTIELVAKGGVPQVPATGVEIVKVTIGARSIRAIGDAAPGDLRTTREDIELEFRDNLVPVPMTFREAPPGLYSTIDLAIDDPDSSPDALNITGRASVGGNVLPFEIENDDDELTVPIAVDTVLAPRTIAVITIEVDVAALVAGIDWSAVPVTGDGRLYIGDGDPDMAGVVTRLATAFAAR